MATNTMIDELLRRGADDWVSVAEVAWVAKSIGRAASDQEILDVAIAAITHVMNGLMEVGDVTDGGFFA